MSVPDSPSFACIVAATRRGGIGLHGALPWRIPVDTAFFRTVTLGERAEAAGPNAVVMGRATWESIPAKLRPLAGRTNVVLSRDAARRRRVSLPRGVLVAGALDEALALLAARRPAVGDIFVIGGASVYAEALRSPRCRAVYLTTIHAEVACDAFVPDIEALGFTRSRAIEAHVHDGVALDMSLFERCAAPPPPPRPPPPPPRHEEHQYLDLIRDVIENGGRRTDRTGTGTLSTFGATMRFSLRDETFPLLTTKRTFFRGVAEELLWFISGDTDASTLRDKGIHIWDANGSREYLDRIGLTGRAEMDLGPVYGFQWRHYGATYAGARADYRGQGVDQLANVIRTIKENPTDRRIVLSAWNPAALPEMALPPCHMFCQFYVGADGALSCQMYQRSADMGLGVPFNIASYALLTRLVAQVCGLAAGELVHVLGDAHVYQNHVAALKEQLEREPRAFPTLKINPAKTDIDDFTYADFTLEHYHPHPKLTMPIAV